VTPTQIAGQQSAPSQVVPTTPAPPIPITQTNTLAWVSLAAAILSFGGHFLLPAGGGAIGAIVAVITGHMARAQIKKTGEQGAGIAMAGLIIGYIHLVLIVIGVLIAMLLIFAFGIVMFGIGR
jgi:hypothetical protein